MSEILPDYSEEQIKEAAIKFVKNVFNINKSPIDVAVTEHIVFVEFDESNGEGMIPHEKYDIVYSLTGQNEVALVNIYTVDYLIEYINKAQNTVISNKTMPIYDETIS